jgi:hypothetical protein
MELLSESAMRLMADAVMYGDRPQRVHRASQANELTQADMAEVIHYVWTRDDNAAWLVVSTEWVKMFRASGLIVRRADQTLPHFPLLYRGTTDDRKRGMAWTREIDTTRDFQSRYKQRDEDAHVCRTFAQQHAVVAMFNTRTEAEIVLTQLAWKVLNRWSNKTGGMSR